MKKAAEVIPDFSWMDGVDAIVVDPIRFKIKLDIGEEAYAILRLRNKVQVAWDTAGAAATGAAIAQSAVVANLFFAPTGFLAAVGLAGAAVTPVGWVIAAGALSAGSWIAIMKLSKQTSASRVKVVPEFINTPMDILGIGLFRLIAPLALKVAEIDGEIHESERVTIRDELVHGWGYSSAFVEAGLAFMETQLSTLTVEAAANELADFKKSNADCNYESMTAEIVRLLKMVIAADGRLTKQEEQAVAVVENLFLLKGRSLAAEIVDVSIEKLGRSAKDAGEAVFHTSVKVKKVAVDVGSNLGDSAITKAKELVRRMKDKNSKGRR